MSLPHRVRERGKRKAAEVTLPSIEALRHGDPMSARVVEQIALGVSTRGYERSLEPTDESIEVRGASKSNRSRAPIDDGGQARAVRLAQPDDVDLVAMSIDGIESRVTGAHRAGVTIDGPRLRSASGRAPPKTRPW